MKILFVAPFPPPITGHSLVSDFIYSSLVEDNEIVVVNLSKNSLKNGNLNLNRFFEVFIVIIKMIYYSHKSDRVYYTISQSPSGFLKDIIVFSFCIPWLNKFIIHSHGMGLSNVILRENLLLRLLAKIFLARISILIVLSDAHMRSFTGLVNMNRIRIIENYFDSDLLIEPEKIEEKFSSSGPIRILFLSNLIQGKGYKELLSAFAALQLITSCKLQLFFAGAFASPSDEFEFLNSLKKVANVEYLGVLSGKERVEQFKTAHIFCLPTYYVFEGQPLSILEAYASGCVVVTTRHAGIPDIFNDFENGRLVEVKSDVDIVSKIIEVIENKDYMLEVARRNNRLAVSRFSQKRFVLDIRNLF